MAIGKCLKCDKIAPMTEDHVFPKWLRKVLPLFNVKVPPTQEINLVCQPCNSIKGPNIDYSNEYTRIIMKDIVMKFTVEIRKYEEFNP